MVSEGFLSGDKQTLSNCSTFQELAAWVEVLYRVFYIPLHFNQSIFKLYDIAVNLLQFVPTLSKTLEKPVHIFAGNEESGFFPFLLLCLYWEYRE